MSSVFFFIFQLAVFIFSVMVHEISHGLMAEKLGDHTARLAGRLTFNPLKHLDPFGSVVLPLSLYFLSGGTMVFGWAKPVPYNPLLLKNPKSDSGKIAAAGPVSNFSLALVLGLLLRFLTTQSSLPFPSQFLVLLDYIVVINLLLAVFNLLPFPPLDGSGILISLLPNNRFGFELARVLERYGLILFLFFILFGFQFITPIIGILYEIIVGHPFGF